MLEGPSAPLASATSSEGDGSKTPQSSEKSWLEVDLPASEAAEPSEGEHHSEEASLAAGAIVTPLQAPLTWKSSWLLLLVSLGTLAVLGQLVKPDVSVAQLASEMSVLQATVNKLLDAQAQTADDDCGSGGGRDHGKEGGSFAPVAWKLIVFCFIVAMVVGRATYVIAMLNAKKTLRQEQVKTREDMTEKMATLQTTVEKRMDKMMTKETMDEQLSKVVSALREEMDEEHAKKDARVAQLESEQSGQGFIDELRLKVGAMEKSLDDERQARSKSMEAMMEKMATKELVNEQLGQLQPDIAELSALEEKCQESQTQLKALQTTVEEKMTTVDEQLGQVREQTGETRRHISAVEADVKTTQTMVESSAKQLSEQSTKLAAQVGQLQSDASASLDSTVKDVYAELSALKEMCKEGQTQLKALQTTVEKKMTTVDEQLGQVREQSRKATAELRSEHDLQKHAVTAAVRELDVVKGRVDERQAQVMSMATTVETMAKELGQTSEQNRKLRDVDAKLDAVEAQVQLKLNAVEAQVKLKLRQVKNPDAIDVVVHASSHGVVQCVLYDGSLVGQPAETGGSFGVNFTNQRWEFADVTRLQQHVETRLTRFGLEGARWLYASDVWLHNFQLPVLIRTLPLSDLQELLRKSRITELGDII